MDRRRFGFLLVLGFMFCKPLAASEEITLFDQKGGPRAYIAEDQTIYLWDGKPVAYLYESDSTVHLYNFTGDHLGWFEEGVLWDHSGAAVGFREGAANIVTYVESVKSSKKAEPAKGPRSVPPVKAHLHDTWSPVPFSVFLKTGAASAL
ncbi:MAG: hypothetical protein DMG13_05675 [Acidobacteria bacterium]|nr:MAG: hypothetical protein DMG13_05675 [Acidobacteriota bacterium]